MVDIEERGTLPPHAVVEREREDRDTWMGGKDTYGMAGGCLSRDIVSNSLREGPSFILNFSNK